MVYQKTGRPRGRPKGTDTAFQKAYDFILLNPYTTRIECARATQVDPRTISSARAQLRKEGKLPNYRSTTLVPDRANLLEGPIVPLSDEMMSPEELMKLLSQKLRGARKIEEVKPLAEALLKMLPKPEQSDETLGPGPPLDEEERIERVGLILRAVGPELAARAVEWARREPVMAADGAVATEPAPGDHDLPIMGEPRVEGS